jgi:hypothetical protein
MSKLIVKTITIVTRKVKDSNSFLIVESLTSPFLILLVTNPWPMYSKSIVLPLSQLIVLVFVLVNNHFGQCQIAHAELEQFVALSKFVLNCNLNWNFWKLIFSYESKKNRKCKWKYRREAKHPITINAIIVLAYLYVVLVCLCMSASIFNLSVFLSVCLCLFACLFVYCLSTCLPACLSTDCLLACLPVYLSACLSTCLSINLSLWQLQLQLAIVGSL